MSAKKTDVAIIGMAGFFPDASSTDEFFDNLSQGVDSVNVPPRSRLVYCGIDPDKDYKEAGHLNRIDQFDHLFFSISKKEAEFMEPTQRISLQLACHAIENAGYNIENFKGSNTGIFIGSNHTYGTGYLHAINETYKHKDPTIHTGTLTSMVFGRIAYELKLTGPAIMVDTGCSSSIVAMSQAVEKLMSGEIDYALVGALNLKAGFFEKGEGSGHLQASSPTGKSRAFDADADGIGVGEGGGMVLLKRNDNAIKDNNNIIAVVKGIAVNQDGGRSNSITAPSPIAQTEVIVKAWENAGINPDSLQYIETHGAGTRLGDVIEFQALTDAFNKYTDKKQFCAISAVKSNIGHLGNAAGIAGLIKAALSLQHKVLLPSLHFHTPNPYIDFDNSSAFVNTALTPWPVVAGQPRRCGVSSFGLSGTNSHMVLEEAPAKSVSGSYEQAGSWFLKVSAKSPSALKNYIANIIDYLTTSGDRFADALYTLNSGRADYNYRTSFTATDSIELIEKLRKAAQDELGVLPLKGKSKNAVLLFPNVLIDNALVNKLLDKNAIIKKTFADVAGFCGLNHPNPYQQTLAVQYGLYLQFKSYGFPVSKVMGTGLGSIITKVITGGIDLEAGTKLLADYETTSTLFKEEIFINTIKEIMIKQDTLFVEMGAKSIFTDKLVFMQHEFPDLVAAQFAETTEASLLDSFSLLYNLGLRVEWDKYYENTDRRIVQAPAYPFDKIRCWYVEPFRQIVDGINEYCYQPDWIRTKMLQKKYQANNELFLIFCDREGLHEELVEALGSDNTCITVEYGSDFVEKTALRYQLNPHDKDSFFKLLDRLKENGQQIDGIFFLSNYVSPYLLSGKNYNNHLKNQFLPFYYLLQAFSGYLKKPGFKLVVPTSNAHRVAGADVPLIPFNTMLTSLMKGVITEYPTLQLTNIDVNFSENTNSEVASIILAEIGNNDLLRFAAIRNNNRFLPVLSQAQFDAAALQQSFKLNENGVYVITGGASGIGLETCKMFAEQGACTLVIIGRTAIDENSSDQQTHEKIAAIKLLIQNGATVDYHSADVSNYEQMTRIISGVTEKYGKIDGVVHAAGIGSSGVSIEDREVADVLATLNAKLGGTIILDELTKASNPAFFLMFSSIASLVPAKNCADYTAANAFEDAFAYKMQLVNKNFVAINWSDWKETGLQYRKNQNRSDEEISMRNAVVQSLSNKEGIAAIKCALILNRPQLVVAKTNLSLFKSNPYFLLGDNVIKNTDAENKQDAVESALAAVPADTVENEVANMASAPVATGDEVTETELQMKEVWYEVLKLDEIALDDDFYEIGGHSLNIVQLLNLIKARFGVEIGIEEMLYNGTIRQLVTRVNELLLSGAPTYETIEPVTQRDFYDISHAQKRFWLLSQLDGKEAYNVPLAFLIKGDLDAKILQQAFNLLLERHESLRTSFELVSGQPMQKVNNAASINFAIKHVDVSDEKDDGALISQIVENEVSLPFDLNDAPLLRALLIKVGAAEHVFCLTMHHIVTDARSIAILKEEILQSYKILSNAEALAFAPLRVQYKDFVAWQNKQLSGERFDQHRKYWLNRLSGCKTRVDLPVDYPSRSASSDAKRVSFMLDENDVSQLRKLAERNSTTIFIVALSLFKLLLAKYTNAGDIVVATPVSGRDDADLDNQIGIYLNTLLLRSVVDQEETFNSFVRKSRHNIGKDFEHQIFPFDLLAEYLQGQQHANGALFNVGFTWNVKNHSTKMDTDDTWTIEDFPIGFVKAKTDLWMLVSELGSLVSCTFVYRTALFKHESVELLKEKFLFLLKQVITGHDKAMSQLDIKLPTEQLLEERKLDISFNF